MGRLTLILGGLALVINCSMSRYYPTAAPDVFLLSNPAEVTFVAAAEQNERGEEVVHLASSGAPIDWAATVTPSVPWLMLSPVQGTAPTLGEPPGELRVSMQSLGLAQGVYSTQITLTAPDQPENVLTIIPVTLIIPSQTQRLFAPLILTRAAHPSSAVLSSPTATTQVRRH